MPNELLNDLRLSILGNMEISGKCENWAQAKSSAQSPLQEKKFGNSARKWNKLAIKLWIKNFQFSISKVSLEVFCEWLKVLMIKAILILKFINYVFVNDTLSLLILFQCGDNAALFWILKLSEISFKIQRKIQNLIFSDNYYKHNNRVAASRWLFTKRIWLKGY